MKKLINHGYIVCLVGMFLSCHKNFQNGNVSSSNSLATAESVGTGVTVSSFGSSSDCNSKYMSAYGDSMRKNFQNNQLNYNKISSDLTNLYNSFVDCSMSMIFQTKTYEQMKGYKTVPKDNSPVPMEIPVIYDSLSCLIVVGAVSNMKDFNVLINSIKNVYLQNPYLFLRYDSSYKYYNLINEDAVAHITPITPYEVPLLNNPYTISFLFAVVQGYPIPYAIARKYFTRPNDVLTVSQVGINGNLPNEYYEIWDGIKVHRRLGDSTEFIPDVVADDAITMTYTIGEFNSYISVAINAYPETSSSLHPLIWNISDILDAVNKFHGTLFEEQNIIGNLYGKREGFINQLIFYLNNYYLLVGNPQSDGTPGALLDPDIIPDFSAEM